ncbi:hypothetical protein EVA_06142 [gut metagenome]|uniref:Uncharacterized protein n=1 Tax=gut metagenome TaxID=749906 RepID=J9GEI0_9ZZZZ
MFFDELRHRHVTFFAKVRNLCQRFDDSRSSQRHFSVEEAAKHFVFLVCFLLSGSSFGL